MHWIHQSNLGTEEKRGEFRKALVELCSLTKATWSEVKLIPFIGTVEPELQYSGKVFALGSTSMTLAARHYGWSPGVIYDDKTFNFEAWRKGWGADKLINGNAWVGKFGDAKFDGPAFVRPCHDMKAFSGFITDGENMKNWQKNVADGEISSGTNQLGLDTPIIVSPEKFILNEWRFFVVNGKVITGSQYRNSYTLWITTDIDKDVWNFAQDRVNEWQPEKCFVLDIAATKDGLGVMEVNCLNSSGRYACDLVKVFVAIEELYDN